MPSDTALEKLQEIIGYQFRDDRAARAAILHPGLRKNSKKASNSFERLEFIGDRVLGLALASFLYERFPEEREGNLAVRIATLAGTDFLIDLVKKTRIMECLAIPGDFFVSRHKNSSAIADMMEAILGAVFLDSNFETAREVVCRLWKKDAERGVHGNKDAKSQLQEVSQARSNELPIYTLIKTTGEVHNPLFEIEVTVCGISACGSGNSKKGAEHDAAGNLLKRLRGVN
ncbi:MAG: ribonuclease III [Holosporaceae bacterium]|jgi:ribonuclease-3|nr:ribonuclease III [Holosporaceae bacterium]